MLLLTVTPTVLLGVCFVQCAVSAAVEVSQFAIVAAMARVLCFNTVISLIWRPPWGGGGHMSLRLVLSPLLRLLLRRLLWLSWCSLCGSHGFVCCGCVSHLQYNRMTEAQERAREQAIAAIKARGDALGDIATRDKEAAKKRAEEEDARLVQEAIRARVRAKEAEVREKKEVCVLVCIVCNCARRRRCACWCV